MASSTGEISLGVYLGVGITLIILCACVVLLRCIMGFKQHKKLALDDYLSIIGLFFITLAFSMNDWIIKRFIDPTALVWLTKMGVVITIVVAFMYWTTKAPILILYTKVFGIRKNLRWACYLTLIILAVALLTSMAPTFAWCRFNQQPLQLATLGSCVLGTTFTGVISGFFTITADLLIFLLPIPPLYALNLPRAKKIGVVLVFLSGILGIAASIISQVFKWQAWKGEASATLTTMLCAVIEGVVAVGIGCVPSVVGFWNTFIIPKPTSKATLYYESQSKGLRSKGGSAHLDTTDSSSRNYILMDSLHSHRGSYIEGS